MRGTRAMHTLSPPDARRTSASRGRAAFEERSIKRLCFIRADVATADVNTELRSYAKLPSGIQTGDDGVSRALQ
jgi:hypothetical protein